MNTERIRNASNKQHWLRNRHNEKAINNKIYKKDTYKRSDGKEGKKRMCKKRSTMPVRGPQQWKIHKRNDGKAGKKMNV